MPAFPDREPPENFDDLVATPGNNWLAENPNSKERGPSHWNKAPVKMKLRQNFNKLCGYSLMHEMRGSVDHYISWKSDKTKAYDWDNYRYCAGAVNSSKQALDAVVFDPFEIEFTWFEIHLPSMIMRVSAAAPDDLRQKLEYTLNRLPIAHVDEVIDYRAEYYEGYKSGEMSLPWVRRKIPVLAASIEAFEAAHPDEVLP